MTTNNGDSRASSPKEAVSPNEVILITGAGGSIGSALTKKLLESGATAIRTLVLLDHSEQNLYEIHSELSSANATATAQLQIISILGDVNDAPLLDELFEKHRPAQIFHAAAFKHVPLMEENPIAVIRNNILGTSTLANAALRHRARRLTMISTDKAANPCSIMGAAKRVAELLLARFDTSATRMRSIRLGNVLGSTGSVVPLFQRQIQNGGPVTVTHPEASRYFISIDEATDLILAAAELDDTATLFVPNLPAPFKILDLAKNLIAEAQSSLAPSGEPIEIVFTGLRPGDKLHEVLLSSSESAEPSTHLKLRRIIGPTPAAKSLDSAINLISEKVQSRDLATLLDAIRSLVPEYQPSEILAAQTSTRLSVTAKA